MLFIGEMSNMRADAKRRLFGRPVETTVVYDASDGMPRNQTRVTSVAHHNMRAYYTEAQEELWGQVAAACVCWRAW